MNDTVTKILEEIKTLETKLQHELETHDKEVNYKIKDGLIEFEKEILSEQKKNMKNLFTYFKEIPFLHLISSPLIYAMIIPALFVDFTLFLYQQTIFRIYKFEKVKRSDYIVFDRHYLAYLNLIEKINCLYCAYFNGLMAYGLEIAARTELYFCPIKHAKKSAYKHSKYDAFLTYGDAQSYQEKLESLRASLQRGRDGTKL